jgi:outer membrane protein
MRRACAVAILVLCLGCASVDEARRAQDPDHARPGERSATLADMGLAPGSTLDLESGVVLSLTHNPQVARARNRAEAAEARLDQAAAGRWPTVTASLSYDESVAGVSSNGAPSLRGASGSREATQSGRIGADLLLTDFGGLAASIRSAAEEARASKLDFQEAEIDAAFAHRSAFFEVLKSEELLRVAEETVRQFEKRLEQVRGFVEVGTRVKYDLTKAQVDLGNARLAAVRARSSIRVARAQLAQTLGLAEDAAFPLAKPPSPAGATASFESIVDEARKSRPRLAAAAAREAAASASVDRAISDLYPGITLSLDYGWSGSLSPAGWSASLGAFLNWLLLSGGAVQARIREAAANLRDSRAARVQVDHDLLLEIRQGVTSVDDARERLDIASLTARQAEENLTLVQGRFENGRASSVELTDAQVALATARGDRIQAEYDLHLAFATLRRSTGNR